MGPTRLISILCTVYRHLVSLFIDWWCFCYDFIDYWPPPLHLCWVNPRAHFTAGLRASASKNQSIASSNLSYFSIIGLQIRTSIMCKFLLKLLNFGTLLSGRCQRLTVSLKTNAPKVKVEVTVDLGPNHVSGQSPVSSTEHTNTLTSFLVSLIIVYKSAHYFRQ